MARKGSKSKVDLDVSDHHLVPVHEILPSKEGLKAVKEAGFTPANLPKIFSDDPAIKRQGPEAGDIVKIIRSSPTAGKLVIYRLVVER